MVANHTIDAKDRGADAMVTPCPLCHLNLDGVDSVRHSGWLDELKLPIKSFGIFNLKAMIGLIPLAIRSQRAGKVPPLIHKNIPDVENVRKIFDKVENKK